MSVVSVPASEVATRYERPVLATVGAENVYVENDAPVFVAALGWVVLVFGGAWAYCKAVCGWNNVRECSTSWLQVKAVCRS